MKRTKIIVIAVACAAAVAATFLGYACFETYWLQVMPTTVRNKNLPAEFTGKKVAFVSDIHCGEGFPFERMAELVESINSLAPDIVLFGGDSVSRSGKDTQRCFATLAKINAPLGKFGVLGNHDIEAGKAEVLAAMKNAGIIPLQNENRRITVDNATISIAGVEETWYSRPNGFKATEGAENFTIFLSHDPSYLEKYRDRRTALMFSGHTHGGQITFFGIPLLWLVHRHNYQYGKGIFEEPDRTIIVTNGIGTGIVPLRFFARPQINLITLQN